MPKEIKIKEEPKESIQIRPGSSAAVQKHAEFDTRDEAEDFIRSEEGYGEMNVRYIPKTKKYRVTWEEVDDLKEDIEKHDTLNPKLFEDGKLKPEVREAVQKIVDKYQEVLKDYDVEFDLKDVILVGSNTSYNYNKNSDLDIHILADTSKLSNPKAYAAVYGAVAGLFNKNYSITFYDIPVEIYVETEDNPVKINGVYSVLEDKWVREPVAQEIPDLDQEAFDALLGEWKLRCERVLESPQSDAEIEDVPEED